MNLYNNDNEYHLISMFQCNKSSKNDIFHVLMNPYLTLLYNRCVYKISDKSSAEDLVQGVIISIKIMW